MNEPSFSRPLYGFIEFSPWNQASVGAVRCQSSGVKLALHRSITFWSGLFVMASIGWGWWDSLRWGTYFTWKNPPASKEVYHAIGGIVIRHRTASPVFDSFLKRSEVYSGVGPLLPGPAFFRGGGQKFGAESGESNPLPDEKTYLEELAGNIQYDPPQDWLLFVPHWLILLSVAALWLFLLCLRARRREQTVLP